jgi:hypothetical protein
MAFAIKAEIHDPRAETFAFMAQKTMYGGKHVAEGDLVFVFASENEGGQGLIAQAVVTSSEATAKERGFARQTPRVSIAVTRTGSRRGPWGGPSSNASRTGATADPRPSSISISIASQRTRSSASRIKRQRSCAASSNHRALGRLFHVMTKLDGFVGSAAIVSSGLKAAPAPRARASIPRAYQPPLPPPP